MYVIYKITNPTGSIYIGQTSNFEDRIKRYKQLRCNRQVKIYHSIKKYGWDAHTIEIIDRCNETNYWEREIYWIDFYKSNYAKHKENNGLNLCDGGKGNKGYKATDESKRKNSDRAKKRGVAHMHTPEMRKKSGMVRSQKYKGVFFGNEMYSFTNGRSEETKKRALNNMIDVVGRKVYCAETGTVFHSIAEAARYIGISDVALGNKLNGKYKNNTSLKFMTYPSLAARCNRSLLSCSLAPCAATTYACVGPTALPTPSIDVWSNLVAA